MPKHLYPAPHAPVVFRIIPEDEIAEVVTATAQRRENQPPEEKPIMSAAPFLRTLYRIK